MARTIGQKNIAWVKRIVKRHLKQGKHGIKYITDLVIDELPMRVFNTWEGARNEIDNLVEETYFCYFYERR